MTVSREIFNKDPLQANAIMGVELKAAECEYVVMAGFMRMLLGPVLDAFPDHVVNIHPALLPSFPGAHGIQDAYDAGVKCGE